jgi:hypothetical protein
MMKTSARTVLLAYSSFFVSLFEFQFQGLYFRSVNIPRYLRMLSQFIVGCF